MWALDIEDVNNVMLKYRQETDEFLICSEDSEILFKNFTGTLSYSRILFFFFAC